MGWCSGWKALLGAAEAMFKEVNPRVVEVGAERMAFKMEDMMRVDWYGFGLEEMERER